MIDADILGSVIEKFISSDINLSPKPVYKDDEKKTAIGYEISFTKYFYKPAELRDMKEIIADLNSLEKEANGMMAEILEGIDS